MSPSRFPPWVVAALIEARGQHGGVIQADGSWSFRSGQIVVSAAPSGYVLETRGIDLREAEAWLGLDRRRPPPPGPDPKIVTAWARAGAPGRDTRRWLESLGAGGIQTSAVREAFEPVDGVSDPVALVAFLDRKGRVAALKKIYVGRSPDSRAVRLGDPAAFLRLGPPPEDAAWVAVDLVTAFRLAALDPARPVLSPATVRALRERWWPPELRALTLVAGEDPQTLKLAHAAAWRCREHGLRVEIRILNAGRLHVG